MTHEKLMLGIFAVLIASCGGDEPPQSKRAPASVPGCIILAYSDTEADTLRTPPVDSALVLEWLRASCVVAGLELVVQSYPFGDLVTQIGHRKNGEGGYWLYKVNGAPVPKSASAHRVARTDTVLFLYK